MKVQLGTTLLNLALGRREVIIEDAKTHERRVVVEEIKPSLGALCFRLKTQDGYRETDRLEHTGAEGGPIRTEDVTEARRAIGGRIQALIDARARRN